MAYDRSYWKDHVTDQSGEVIQQGTLLDQQHFNNIGIYLGFKREFSKLIGFLVVALIAVGLVFNAGGVKDVLLELFNKIIGAYGTDKTGNQQSTSRCYQLCGGVRAVRFIYCLCSRLYQEDK